MVFKSFIDTHESVRQPYWPLSCDESLDHLKVTRWKRFTHMMRYLQLKLNWTRDFQDLFQNFTSNRIQNFISWDAVIFWILLCVKFWNERRKISVRCELNWKSRRICVQSPQGLPVNIQRFHYSRAFSRVDLKVFLKQCIFWTSLAAKDTEEKAGNWDPWWARECQQGITDSKIFCRTCKSVSWWNWSYSLDNCTGYFLCARDVVNESLRDGALLLNSCFTLFGHVGLSIGINGWSEMSGMNANSFAKY